MSSSLTLCDELRGNKKTMLLLEYLAVTYFLSILVAVEPREPVAALEGLAYLGETDSRVRKSVAEDEAPELPDHVERVQHPTVSGLGGPPSVKNVSHDVQGQSRQQEL